MNTTDELLKRVQPVFSFLEEKNVIEAIKSFRQLLVSEQLIAYMDSLDAIEDNYELVLNFMRQGGQDAHRVNIFNGILRQLNILVLNYCMQWVKKNVTSFSDCDIRAAKVKDLSPDVIRKTLEDFLCEKVMLSLEKESANNTKRDNITSSHFEFLNDVFCSLIVDGQWTDEKSKFYTDMFLSPAMDSFDSIVLVSAISLSLLEIPDYNKFNCLVKVYLGTSDEALRQRALVGWTFSLSREPEFVSEREKDIYRPLLEDERVRKDLLELQEQVFYCEDAEKDKEEIQKNIMPDIINSNNFNAMRFGEMDNDSDPLDDILNSNESEKMMEDVEESVLRMQEMQRKGKDVFFGGFSKMKRFGFFYSLINWFIPFYSEHPELSRIRKSFGNKSALEKMLKSTPFCDSDKYSFVFAMSSIFNSLPEQVRQMISNGEVQAVSMLPENTQSPAFIRRIYLQNLYRFYMLSSMKDQFTNPFDTARESKGAYPKSKFFFTGLLNHSCMMGTIVKLGKFLYKRKDYQSLAALLKDVDTESVDICLLKAYVCRYHRDYKSMIKELERVLSIDPENMPATKLIARAHFNLRDYVEAAKLYDKLTILFPDDKNLMIFYCISLINSGEVQKAIKYLSKLNLQYPNDYNVNRSIAWGSLMLADYEKAEFIYQNILSSAESSIEDYLNAGYSSWLSGDLKTAKTRFDMVKSLLDDKNLQSQETLFDLFCNDKDFLFSKGVTIEDMRMMSDL